MSFRGLQQAIEAHVAAHWTATPVAYDNVDFVPPSPDPWIRIRVDHGASRLVGLGAGRLVRHSGVVLVHVFVPDGTGTQDAFAVADAALALFAAADLPGVVFGIGAAMRERDDAPDAAATATIPFWRDEVVA